MIKNNIELKDRIVKKALELGACAAGIADVQVLKKSPSHRVYAKIGEHNTVENGIAPGEVHWPTDAKSAIVVAVEHSEEKPELDWWIENYSGGTPGNRKLMGVNDQLALWLKNEIGIKTKKLPYYPGHGGILLKDAAVLAGLGCLGKNNMLIMPDYGPRVRLRALLADVLLPGTGPIDFDPCRDCDTPCRSVCPQKAFDLTIYSEKELGTRQLPARSGAFSWPLCRRQMEIDRSQAEHIKVEGEAGRRKAVENCRLCEYSCPVGQ